MFQEYEGADDELTSKADIVAIPTFDVFYQGNRVGLVEEPSLYEQDLLIQFQLLNSQLDLFSDEANNERRIKWEEGKLKAGVTPTTMARLIPGYDWDFNQGLFDETADGFDFESSYENWIPNYR